MKGRALTLRPPPFVPPRKGEGSARPILHAIPFPRLRLAGDDTLSDPQCQTLVVMAGLVPAIHAFNLLKDVDARHKAGHDDRGFIPGRSEAEGKGIHSAPGEILLSANPKRNNLGNPPPAAGTPALP